MSIRALALVAAVIATAALLWSCGPPVASSTTAHVGGSSIGAPTSGSRTSGTGTGTGTSGNTGNVPAGNAPLAVGLTDDPFPYPFLSSIAVLIQRIEVEPAGGSWVVLEDWGSTPGLYEVMGLQNGQVKPIVTKSLPAGSYDQVRVTFAGAHVRSLSGEAFNAQGGSLVFAAPIALSLASPGGAVILDLDLASSITVQTASFLNGRPLSDASQISGATFSPVGRVAVAGSGGGIAGTVQDSGGARIAGATVRVLSSGAPVTSTSSDSSGNFALIELPPGDYTVLAEAFGQSVPATTDATVVQGSNASATLVFGAPQPVPSPSPSPLPQPTPVPLPSPPAGPLPPVPGGDTGNGIRVGHGHGD